MSFLAMAEDQAKTMECRVAECARCNDVVVLNLPGLRDGCSHVRFYHGFCRNSTPCRKGYKYATLDEWEECRRKAKTRAYHFQREKEAKIPSSDGLYQWITGLKKQCVWRLESLNDWDDTWYPQTGFAVYERLVVRGEDVSSEWIVVEEEAF